MNAYVDLLLDYALRAYQAGNLTGTETLLRLLLGRCGPRDAQVVYVLGHLTLMKGQPEQAHWLLSRALAMVPEHPGALVELGAALRALGRPDEALAYLQRAMALDPSFAPVYAGLAATYGALHRPAEALPWAKKALERTTNKGAAHCDLGSILGRLERHTEAIKHYDHALQLQPNDARARYFRALIRLTRGDWLDAWSDYEARLAMPAHLSGRRSFAQPLWRGTDPLDRRTILLHAEQGFGDTIQFARYAPLVAERGGTVVLQVQRGLGRLCETIDGVAQVVEFGGTLPPFDLQCPLLSLPAVFATSIETVPPTVPYLTPDAAVRAAWAQTLGPWRKMRVGLAWSGNAKRASDPNRSIPLQNLAMLLQRDDIACHVIQRDIAPADQATMTKYPALFDHSQMLTDFMETAALVSLMDLVISVDTAAAHLAGALSVPAWVMLAHNADWRWLRGRADSPWYPTLRLFRQTQRGDWRPVLERVARDVDAWSVQRS